MRRIVGLALLMAGAATFAFAGVPPAPEIDAAAGPAAIGLVAGALLILRARKNKKG